MKIFPSISKFICLSFILLSSPSIAEGDSNVDNMIKYNPDVKKYEFVKSYIAALSYIKVNAERNEKYAAFTSKQIEELKPGRLLMDNLILDNNNIRVAKHYMLKYNKSENGLMLKAVDVFVNFSEQQLSLNNEERAILDELFEAHVNETIDGFDKKSFMLEQARLASLRKESWKDILRASLFIPKILISDQKNEMGELTWLAIDETERVKLLMKLDEFYGDLYKGDLRVGQTFLQGSIAVIRDILEDSSWDSLPEGP